MRALASAMGNCLRHRGPDHGQVWLAPDAPLALSHRRLAIIDLSPDANQPMTSAGGRYTIAYNGEIYNFQNLRAQLEAQKITFKTRSDTEVLLCAVEHWGLNQTLQKINGMFAFALWDSASRELHFVRDRFGKKPLYIGWVENDLVFASELKAFFAHPGFTGARRSDIAAQYLTFGYIAAPYSIYENICMLLPGHRLSVKIDALGARPDLTALMKPYWNALQTLEQQRANPVTGDEESIVAEFERLLFSCVQDRMISDVAIGAFLSGGIDSASIAALMQRASNRPVHTYTIGFHEDGFDEAAHARKIAHHLGTDHHEYYMSEREALDAIPSLQDMYDEPFGDISALPSALVSKFARRDVTVALTGDGGDEMLGGYKRHGAAQNLSRLLLLPQPFRSAATLMVETLGRAAPSDKALKALSSSDETQQYKAMAGLGDPRFAHQASSVPPTVLDLYHFNMAGLNPAERMMARDILFYLPNDILTKIDRASMAASLEARAPLLDVRVFDFAWRLPLAYKIRHGKGKYLMRQMLKKYVPESYFERPKQGFNIPVDAWLRGALKPWAEDLLNGIDPHELNKKTILSLWRRHGNGTGSHGAALWTVLMYLAWRQRQKTIRNKP